jgi:CopA family copper-resistance protein
MTVMTKHNRRQFLRTSALFGAGVAANTLFPRWAWSAAPGLGPTLPTLTGQDIALTIGHTSLTVDGRAGHAVAINGTIPGPLIRLREGQNVRFSVTNRLDEDTSIHWHGVLVPFQFDGVPGVSFPGIRPGETFVYEFPIRQYGTYWYHSHSGLQEQEGHYGPLIFDPAGADPIQYDREHVVVLSDFSFMHPHTIFRRLKQQPGVFNFQKQTLSSLAEDTDLPLAERAMWAQMRMDPTDISDVTGAVLSFLINGHGPEDNWTALFAPGERVRLRFINAAASTIFNVRIPGLKLTVVQADGQNVEPVEVDEFQISVAETYDVIVQPTQDRAYTLVAEAIDRSGMGRATLAPRPGMTAPVPRLRERPLLTMKDMGMDHGAMAQPAGSAPAAIDHAAMGHAPAAAAPAADAAAPVDHAAMGHAVDSAGAAAPAAVDHAAMGHTMGAGAAAMHMNMNMRDPRLAPQVKMGPGVQMISPMPVDRTGEPGTGLENVLHKVLVYTDLVALEPNPDPRPPSRTKEIHLTGNMERFMWSFDGEEFSEVAAPIAFRRNERVRVVLVNDTMMNHPIHLHGHFFEVVNGHPGRHPRKHTVNVKPGGKVTFDLTADAPGDWAFHCHLLFHMHAGMLQVVTVRPLDGAVG